MPTEKRQLTGSLWTRLYFRKQSCIFIVSTSLFAAFGRNHENGHELCIIPEADLSTERNA